VASDGAGPPVPGLLWQSRDGTAAPIGDLLYPEKATQRALPEALNKGSEEQPNRPIGATLLGMQTNLPDDSMRAFYAARLQQTLQQCAAVAERAGLTPELLEDLLRDES
jgi:hypothetical protein